MTITPFSKKNLTQFGLARVGIELGINDMLKDVQHKPRNLHNMQRDVQHMCKDVQLMCVTLRKR